MTTDSFELRRTEMLKHKDQNILDYLDMLTGEWHDGAGEDMSLRDYMGLTKEEYQVFVVDPHNLVISDI